MSCRPEELFAPKSDLSKAIQRFIDEDFSKFVLIPLARDDREVFEQTQRLIDEVLPVVHAWS